MADCKACGAWFGSSAPGDLCPACEKALVRLGSYVRPVVRGRWEGAEYDGYADGLPVYDTWRCTACGAEIDSDDEPHFAFCPNCGADMRGPSKMAGPTVVDAEAAQFARRVGREEV